MAQGDTLQPGTRIRVKASITVYHLKGTKGKGVDVGGRVGTVEARADHQGETTISATLPLKVCAP